METVKEMIFALNESGAKWAQFVCPKCGTTYQSPNGNKKERVICTECAGKVLARFDKFIKMGGDEND